MDCEPDVFKVTIKEPTPLVRPAFGGKPAWPSLEEIETVPK
jgi:hypothetical protein